MAFGAWAIVGGFNWGDQDVQDSIAALRAAFDEGITLIDTAELYGNGASEELIHRALGDVRDEVVIASKVASSHLAPEDLKAACERSLKALGTDRIDLYQIHWPSRTVPLEDSLAAMEELKQEGKIRAIGVSNFGPQDLGDLLNQSSSIVTNQVAYNLIFRAIEYEIQPICDRENIGILCYSPLMQGLLTGKFATADDVPEDRARTRHFSSHRPQTRHGEAGVEEETFSALQQIREIAVELGVSMADLTLAWLMKQPAVSSVIVGGRNAGQVKRNCNALKLDLSDDVEKQLRTATRSLKEAMGPNADLWQGEPSRIR